MTTADIRIRPDLLIGGGWAHDWGGAPDVLAGQGNVSYRIISDPYDQSKITNQSDVLPADPLRATFYYPRLADYLPSGAWPVSIQTYFRARVTDGLFNGPIGDSGFFVNNLTATINLALAEGSVVWSQQARLNASFQDIWGVPVPWNHAYTDAATAPLVEFRVPLAGSRQYDDFGQPLVSELQTWYEVSTAIIRMVYATQPVVSVVLPNTPQQSTNKPAFSYNYTAGSDGGSQVARRVKVYFGLATPQFGVNNFDPENAPAVWDSGEVATNSTSGQVTVALNNNANYTIFVKAAQSINGALHWSNWAASTFSIQIPPAVVPPKPSIAAVADNNLARIRLTVTAGGTPNWDHVTVERSTDRKNWLPVRSAENQPAGGSTFVVWDYESGNGEVVYYRAFALRTNTIAGQTFETTSPQSNPAGPVSWASAYTWLKSPTRPAFNRTVRFSHPPDETYPIPQSVWSVPGRRNPVVVSGVRSGARFPGCSFTTIDPDASDDLLDLFMLSEPLLLQTPPKHRVGSRYMSAGDLTRGRVSRLIQHDPRTFKVDLTEVDRPAGPIVAVPWTWADVLAKYPTWQSVKDNFATWADLIGATPKSAPAPVTPPTTLGNSLTDHQGNIITDNLANEITD